ncbi:MAG TPA: hypothetical protein VLN44_09300 [Pyrinomonadaceae bacterium]|nr:hypothetical protein [Pyrinomonadaceae bacterium]
MLKSVAVIVFLLGFVQAASGSQSDWIKVAPVGGGFSVMMPAKPEEDVRLGDDFSAHLFTVTTDNALYTVAYGDYAPSVRFNVDDELAANRDNFLKRLNAGLISTKQLMIEGRKGIEFTGENDQASFKSRVFIFGIRFYQIAVAVFKGSEDTANSNRFFASFEFAKAGTRPKT